MAEEEVKFIDPEFQTSGNEKIDFKMILMRRIEIISMYRANDMGEFSMFEFKADLFSDEHFSKIMSNINMFQNAVKALDGLLTTYKDDMYYKAVLNIKSKYSNAINVVINKKKISTKKQNGGKLPLKEWLEWEKQKRRELTLKYAVKMYDEIYEELMRVSKRAKFLGGDDSMTVNYD